MSLTRKQRVKRVLAREPVDRVPWSFSFTLAVQRRLRRHFGTTDLDQALGNHIVSLTVTPAHGYHPLDYAGSTHEDEFGTVWGGDLTRDRGYPVCHPLSAPTLKGYRFPDPADERRFDHIIPTAEKYPDRFLLPSLGPGGLWERAFYLRGFEELLVDLHENPGFVEELLDHVADYQVRTVEILASGFAPYIDGIMIPDDYGSQQDLLFSPATWRHFLKPRLGRIFAAVRGHGLPTFLHSDGNITRIVPDLIEIGLNVLNPVQAEAMDVGWVKDTYGRQLVLYGGICTQRILPDGSPEDVRREVREKVTRLGAGGGYIASTGITIQSDVPMANLEALLVELNRACASAP